jgi:arginine N-succinyltransferase
MLVFRPVRFADLPAIEHLAVIAGHSMTTLPNNRDHLAQLINSTKHSLVNDSDEPTNQSYHFVLENSESNEIIGISGIEANVGNNTPFYSYFCDQLEHKSAELQIENTIATLRLTQDYDGASRLCTFFLASECSDSFALPLLSLSRLMFIGQHKQRFNKKLMFELQGIVDEQRQSPFWLALGQHFFNMDFQKANYLTGINSKSFIADLMPQHPVYVPLLAQEAQQVIGKQRPDMQSVKSLLTQEGFNSNGYISIFDGGPTLEAKTNKIKTIKNQIKTSAHLSDKALFSQLENSVSDSLETQRDELQSVLISNNSIKDYRCIHATITQADFKHCQTRPLPITKQIADLLQIKQADTMFVLPLSNAQLAIHNVQNQVPKQTLKHPFNDHSEI